MTGKNTIATLYLPSLARYRDVISYMKLSTA